MRPSLAIHADLESVSRAAASFVRRRIEERLRRTGRCTVALSGGGTPERCYRLLAQDMLDARSDWSGVDWFFSDERAVGPDHVDSNHRMAHAVLLEPLGVDAAHVHRMQGERDDLAAAADDYQRQIARVLSSDPEGAPPALDLVLLGLGTDGHTASLFPRTEALAEDRRWVVANDVPRLGVKRLTMTAPLLNAASERLVLVAGESKAAALAAVLQGPRRPEELPAQLVKLEGTLWLADRAAAARVSNATIDLWPGIEP